MSAVCAGTIPRILEQLRGNSVADIGCGCGDFALAAACRGFSVAPCDASTEMTQISNECLAGMGVSAVVDHLPELGTYRCDSYDNVVANFVVNHMPDPDSAIRGLARVAKLGGLVISTIWTTDFLPHRDLVRQEVERHMNGDQANEGVPRVIDSWRSVDGLASVNEAAGLSVLNTELVEWEWATRWESFWLGMNAGIGGTGEAYLSNPAEIRREIEANVRQSCERYAGSDGKLRFPCQAALCVARKAEK